MPNIQIEVDHAGRVLPATEYLQGYQEYVIEKATISVWPDNSPGGTDAIRIILNVSPSED